MTEHEPQEPARDATPGQPTEQPESTGQPQNTEQPQSTGQQQNRDPSVQQVADGARQIAAGAKGFFVTRVAPAAQSAGKSVRQAVNEAADTSGQANPLPGWARWAPPALAACAFFVLLALFLPAASVLGFSANLLGDEFSGEGWFLLVLLLVTIAAAAVATLRPARWSRLTAGIIGVITGLIGVIDGFMLMSQVSGSRGMSVGPGLLFLTLWSVGMLLAAVGILWSLRSAPTPAAHQPAAGLGEQPQEPHRPSQSPPPPPPAEWQ
ncbi:hypothetical protein [Ornithinimicrobium faecis]|uniref:hypothetical protein n=1 Tax=Ornithinimicrobium faecis TaxID=2934158 RepID=UPI00211939AB|nr:hypothetical protein [Ornithinimicrobium sp. HY1745]